MHIFIHTFTYATSEHIFTRKHMYTHTCICIYNTGVNGEHVIRHFCSCNGSNKSIWKDIQIFHDLPGAEISDGECIHICALQDYLGGPNTRAYMDIIDDFSDYQACEAICAIFVCRHAYICPWSSMKHDAS